MAAFSITAVSQTNVILGEGTGSGTSSPVASWYESSATESIYTGAEIGLNGQITKLAYQKASGNSTIAPSIKIYMKHTAQAFIGESDYSVGTSGFAGYTLVYDNVLPNNSTSGWMEVTLQTPFTYSSAQNLSILVIGSTCISSGRPQYRYTTAQGNRMSAGYDDGSIGCGGNNPWTAASVMEPVWERPNVRLGFGTLASESFSEANTLVYSQDGLLNIASVVEMANVKVYDMVGKEVFSIRDINSAAVALNGLAAKGQMLIIKITDSYGRVINKKTVY